MTRRFQLKQHTSVFLALLVEGGDEIPGGPFVLFVRNVASDGKPAGYGLPGGGSESGETPDDAVRREASAEAGLEIQGSLEQIFAQSGYRAKNEATNQVNHAKTLERLDAKPWEEVTESRKVILFGRDAVLTSPSQRRIGEFFAEAAKTSQDEDGIHVPLTPDIADELGITETGEVDGVALVPASAIGRIADREAALRKARQPGEYYISHLGPVRGKLRSLGLIDD